MVTDHLKTSDEKEKAKQSVLDSLTDFAKLRFPTGMSASISPNIQNSFLRGVDSQELLT